MSFTWIISCSALGLFFGMLIFSEIGRRIGIARIARNPDGLAEGVGAAGAAVFGLLGLIMAFTFSGAATRFEDRRHLITAEVNAIGTAYLRIDLLPSDAQPEIKALMRQYVETRSTTHQTSDLSAINSKLAKAATLQSEIWTKALIACRRSDAPTQAATLLLPALNEMIDITTTRAMAAENHPPLVVFLLLGGLSLIGALLVGYDSSTNKERSWFHTIVFAAIMSMAVYVIVDLEFPRLGMIRVDAADQLLIDLWKSMT